MIVDKRVAGRYRTTKYHVVNAGSTFSFCGKDANGWLERGVVDAKEALLDPNCCANCKLSLKETVYPKRKATPYLSAGHI